MIVSEEICFIMYVNDLLDQLLTQTSVKRTNFTEVQKKLRFLDAIFFN